MKHSILSKVEHLNDFPNVALAIYSRPVLQTTSTYFGYIQRQLCRTFDACLNLFELLHDRDNF